MSRETKCGPVGVQRLDTHHVRRGIAEAAGPPGVQRRMLVATIANSVVAIYVRLESPTVTGDALRTLWRSLRANLFLAEPMSFNDR